MHQNTILDFKSAQLSEKQAVLFYWSVEVPKSIMIMIPKVQVK